MAGSEVVTVKGGMKGGAPVTQDEGVSEGVADLKQALQASAALVYLSHECRQMRSSLYMRQDAAILLHGFGNDASER